MALAVLVAIGFMAASLGGWLFLARWVPREGKTRVIAEVESRLPVRVSIGAMRYGLWHGLVLEEVRVTRRDSSELWAVLPSVQLHVSRLALLRRHIAFSGRIAVETPCAARVSLVGDYSLASRSAAIDAQTDEISLRGLSPPVARRLPQELTDGAVRLRLHLLQDPGTAPELAGRITGTGLAWTAPGWRASGNGVLNWRAIPRMHADGRWALHADVRLAHGVLDGITAVGPITGIEADARLTEDGLELEQASGTMLDSPWKLRGSLAFGSGRFESLLTGHQRLGPLLAVFPASAREWEADGTAVVRIGCRGLAGVRLPPDCLVHADLHEAEVRGRRLIAPLTNISAGADFDALALRLTLASLEGRLNGNPVAVRGAVDLRPPRRLALHAQGRLPLEAITPWLADMPHLSGLDGQSAFDLQIGGSIQHPDPAGTIELRNAAALLRQPPLAFQRLQASLQLSPEAVELREADFLLNGHPVHAQGRLGRTREPEFSVVVHLPEGDADVQGRAAADRFQLDHATLSLAKSRLSAQGSITRTARRPSALTMSGTIELSELSSLPFLPLPSLEPWALRGLAQIEGAFQGRLEDWPAASIRGRIRSRLLSVRQLPLEQLVCTFEQRGGTLQAQIPSALFADGKLAAELTVTHQAAGRQDVSAQADLIGMALDRLTQVIPAWHYRAASGRASAHVALSGTWQAPPTWNGEGWLKADGEQLGDVPLLDTLFRGLFGVLADRMGLEALRKAQVTSLAGRWRLLQSRIATDDLRLGGSAANEPVAIYAKGSVGLDRTLDFVIEPELSEGVMLEAPTTATLARAVLKAAGRLERLRRLIGRHRLTGTLDAPVYRFEYSTQEVFKQLGPAPMDLLQNLLDAVR